MGKSRLWGLRLKTSNYGSGPQIDDGEDGSFAHHSETHDICLDELRLLGPGESSDVECGFEPVAGEALHVLYAVHGTGDSYGNEDGLVMPLAAFRTLEAAHRAAAAFECGGTDEREVAFLDEDGSVRSVHVPWTGYFESLEGARIKTMAVGPAPAPARARRAKAGGP